MANTRHHIVMQTVNYGMGELYRVEDLKKPLEEGTIALIADPKLAHKVFDMIKEDIENGMIYKGGVK